MDSLPQRMTNEELAVALLAIFKPFGPVASVKASRDQRGRPFGFVEYGDAQAAASALAYGPCLTLDSRRLRVEPAKRQRKLCIKMRLGGDSPLDAALDSMRQALQEHVSDEDFKLSLQGAHEAEWALLGEQASLGEPVVAAVVKFEDPIRARVAAEAWKSGHPDWILTWINMDRGAFGSNVRNSGLVQLVPGVDGSLPYAATTYPRWSPPPGFFFEATTTTPTPGTPPPNYLNNGGMASLIGGNFPGIHSPALTPRYAPSYEEASYGDGGDIILEPLSLDRLTLNDPQVDDWLGCTLFVGRLNGQSVTLPLLYEHFGVHGPLCYIRLYNRGAVGYDGVPLDAYAFLRFTDTASIPRAINAEHGRAWLGQAIKCEPARPAALAIMLSSPGPFPIPSGRQSGAVSPMPFSPYPGLAVYYPLIPPVSPIPTPKATGNWFRAKADMGLASPPPAI